MSSIVARAKSFHQPSTGFVKTYAFKQIKFEDDNILHGAENLSPILVGSAVDRLSKLLLGESKENLFKNSITGVQSALDSGYKDADKILQDCLDNIVELNTKSIINTCKAITFESWKINPIQAVYSKHASDLNPNAEVIDNIKIMVERTVNYYNSLGTLKYINFTFKDNDLTDKIDEGTIDFLTYDTAWDLKVSKYKPKIDSTLQMLIYYIMGTHSEKEEFRNITKLGIFNPKLYSCYILQTDKIDNNIIDIVSKRVVGYS